MSRRRGMGNFEFLAILVLGYLAGLISGLGIWG